MSDLLLECQHLEFFLFSIIGFSKNFYCLIFWRNHNEILGCHILQCPYSLAVKQQSYAIHVCYTVSLQLLEDVDTEEAL